MALGDSPESVKPLDDERLTRVASSVPVALIEVDAHGDVLSATAYFYAMCGIDGTRALGRGWMDRVDPADRAYVARAWDDAVRACRATEIRFRFVHAHARVGARLLLAPVLDAGGVTSTFAAAMTNITELMDDAADVRRRGEQFRVMVEAMPQLAWIAAADGTIEYFNTPWLAYTGVSTEDMRKPELPGVVHPDETAQTIQAWHEAVRSGSPYEIEYRLRRKSDGTYRWFIARAIPVRDEGGNVTRWIGTATDIDTQKRANANLRFVLDASNVLSSSYDVAAICRNLGAIAVERVADWCFVTLAEGEGRYTTSAIAHRDPSRIQYVEQFADRYPVRPGSALDECVRGNRPLLIPFVDAQQIHEAATDEVHLALLEHLRMRSVMIVPLSTGDRAPYGAVSFVSSESGRAFGPEDLEVAQMVARRAASALQTAMLVDEERSRSARLQFIARASDIIFESQDLRSTFDSVTRLLTSQMADLAYVMQIEDGVTLRTVSCAHRDPSKGAIAAHLVGQRTLRPDAEERAFLMLSQHRIIVNGGITSDQILPNIWEYLAADIRALNIHSAITVPLYSRGETFGALVAYWCETPKEYTQSDVPIFNDVGRRLSIAIEHVNALHRERRIAEALQQALLPSPQALPELPNLSFAAEYRPSSKEVEVGGDWYDALRLPDETLMISVGDVTGRGLEAAGMMGTLRQAISMAALHERNPARLLDEVDFQLRSRSRDALATAFVGFIDPQRSQLCYANAGHPPPLLRRRHELSELRAGGLPLGLRDNGEPESPQVVCLADACMVALYTDGLVEGTRDLAFGERRLRAVASSEAILFARSPAQLLCDACLPFEAQDDTAVLTLLFGERTQWSFDADNAQAAHDARHEFMAVLRADGEPRADYHAAEVVFGELVSNVVRHAPGAIDVQLQWSGTYPVLHVTDHGKGFVRDAALPADPFSESGRGLYIISQLARSVTIERIAGYGNHLAVELNVRRG